MDPPQGNPLRKMYEDWSSRTTLVTRSVFLLIIFLYLTTFLLPLDTMFTNIPYFTIQHFEIYRLLLAPMVGNSFFTIILMAFFYPAMGSRVESSVGSAAYLFDILIIGVVTNVLFTAVCILLSLVGMSEAMFFSSAGFWTIIFALIMIECLQIPDAPRSFFFIEVPSKYYPFVLFGVFCLLSGFNLGYAFALLVGFLMHHGKLNMMKFSLSRLQQMESSGWLSNLSRNPGWVQSTSALGVAAYYASAPLAPNDSSDQQQAYSQQQQQQHQQQEDSGSTAGSVFRTGRQQSKQGSKPSESKVNTSFPGSGHTLSSSSGGAFSLAGFGGTSSASSNRNDVNARRLAALAQQQKHVVGQVVPPSASAEDGGLLEEELSVLMEMGYGRADARAALQQAGGRIEEALALLQ